MIGFSNAVFAANLSHANAMMWWLGLDPGIWHANIYGGKMRDRYDRAILVRPVDGVTQEHFAWIAAMLVPRVRDVDNITPLHWRYAEFPQPTSLEDHLYHDPYDIQGLS